MTVQKQDTVELSVVAGLIFLSSETAEFYVKDKDFLGLKLSGEDKGRVALHRALPVSKPNEWICVMDAEAKELGVIRRIDDFKGEQGNMLLRELSVRYYTPEVERIRSAKEKMGYVYFDLTLGAGRKSIAVKDVSKSIRQLDDNRIIILDVDGNRYMISNFDKLDRTSVKCISAYLF